MIWVCTICVMAQMFMGDHGAKYGEPIFVRTGSFFPAWDRPNSDQVCCITIRGAVPAQGGQRGLERGGSVGRERGGSHSFGSGACLNQVRDKLQKEVPARDYSNVKVYVRQWWANKGEMNGSGWVTLARGLPGSYPLMISDRSKRHPSAEGSDPSCCPEHATPSALGSVRGAACSVRTPGRRRPRRCVCLEHRPLPW